MIELLKKTFFIAFEVWTKLTAVFFLQIEAWIKNSLKLDDFFFQNFWALNLKITTISHFHAVLPNVHVSVTHLRQYIYY